MRSVPRLPVPARIAVLCVCVVLVACGLVYLEERQAGEKGTGRPTTYSNGSLGYRALFLWLKALGLPVKRWESPFGALSSEVAVLVVLQPELGPDPGELRRLEQWVEKGGTLLVSSVPAGPFMAHFGLEGKMSPERLQGGGQGRRVRGRPGPYLSGEHRVVRKVPQGLTSLRPEAIAHAGDAGGGLVVVVKKGRGQVIGFADPLLFTNQALREGDHAHMILDLLLSHPEKGFVAVDEYHHGYGRATTVLGHVAQSRAFPLLLQGVVIFLFFWAYAGRRFGPPRPVRQAEARASMDYVRAMARLFQRGQKRAFALEGSIRRTKEEAVRLLVDRDPSLEKALLSARRYLKGQDLALTDEELMRQARGLYGALEKARRGG